MSKRAWVTLATNDSYGLGALVLAHSLRRAGSVYPAVVLITPSVTQPMRDRLSAVFAEVITVDVLDSKDAAHLALLQRPELGITFTKIHCWNLTQYEKCVFLDADTLVVQNSDELFERVELSAAPDVGWPDCFNSGVFVFQPSPETFEKLIKFAQERGSFDGGDQGLLNSFFADWAHGDINKHLPFVYNVTSAAFYSYLPALKHYGQNLKIIHFIGAAKPWLQQYNWESGSVEAPEHLREFLQLWWDLFVANVHAQLDISMSGVAGNLARVVPGTAGFQREALDELTRRQGWEAGNIDYMGADSFDNIWAKISQTLSQPRPSPPKQSPPRESASPEKSSPVTESQTQPEPEKMGDDRKNVIQEVVAEPIKIVQEAQALDTSVTDTVATVKDSVSLEKAKSDVTLEVGTPSKAIPLEEPAVIGIVPAAADIVEPSDPVTKLSPEVKNQTPGKTEATTELPVSEVVQTQENKPLIETSLKEQTIAPLETSSAALDTSIPIPNPNAAVPLVTPTSVVAAQGVLISKEVLSIETVKTPAVESNEQDKPLTDDVPASLQEEPSIIKEVTPSAVPETTVLKDNVVTLAKEIPTSIETVESVTKKVPVTAEIPSSALSETPIKVTATVEAKIPAEAKALSFEALASKADDKAAEMTKEDFVKKIDTTKVPHTPPTTPKSTPEPTTPVVESAPKIDPLDTTQKIALSKETSASKGQETINTSIITPASQISTDISSPTAPAIKATPEKPSDTRDAINTPIITPASPISTDISSSTATAIKVTPEKPSDAQNTSTDSPPLANTPSKEEAPALPAAKSEERRKPVGKLQLSPPTVADPLPTPDSELEDAATLAQSIIASELKTPTVSSPSPSTVPTSPMPPKQEKRLSVEEPEVPTPPVGAVSLAQIGVKPAKGKSNIAAQIESSVTEKSESVSKTEKILPSKTSEPSASADVKKKAVKKAAAKESSGVEAPVPPPRKKEKKPKEK